MKFAEFHAGQVIEGGPFHLTEDEVLRFAATYDPQWFHTNPEAAAQGPFGGIIASGWQACAITRTLNSSACRRQLRLAGCEVVGLV